METAAPVRNSGGVKVVLGGVSIGCLGFVAACALAPLAPLPPPRQTNMGLHISSSTLGNGLRVVLVEDPKAPEVQVTMRYQVGAIDDPAAQTGVAHLVEHLMFQQVLGGQSIFAKLEGITSSFNGTTSLDATTYVAHAQPTHLDELLSIEAVRLGFRCTSITDSVFTRERAVVMNEVAMRDESSELVNAVNLGLYPAGHPYAVRAGGDERAVGTITREQACAFADAHYAPSNAVLVVSGNLTPQVLETALGKFLARTAKRQAAPTATIPALPLTARRVEASAPIDDDVVLVAWPLPEDPRVRAKVSAIMRTVTRLIDDEIVGRAQLIRFGDRRAPMLGVAIAPGKRETVADVLEGAERGVNGLRARFGLLGRLEIGEAMFDQIQQSAIYQQFSMLEAGGDRDEQIASLVLAGQDPGPVIGDELQGLREFTREQAIAVVSQHLAFDHATVVILKPRETTRRGRAPTFEAPIHDMGQRRDPPDPTEAHRPATGSLAAAPSDVKLRTLPNGLKVVLLPLTSVPTVDIRLVFNAGAGDEPPTQRGVATLAADGLTWDARYLNDYLLFAASGGSDTQNVAPDHTTFIVQGLDMHLDILLAGLRRRVRNGRYTDAAATMLEARRKAAKRSTEDVAFTDAQLVAQFGSGHPYVAAGRVRYASATLDADDAQAFRTAHYTPDNATLVIAGRFDAAVADRWIDFLFGDWKGIAEPRSSPTRVTQAVSLAHDAATTQVRIGVSLPATIGARAPQLVAAAMLDDIAHDVRHQLGASYAIDASLGEARLATNYVMYGTIDATRIRDAAALLRARFDQLRTDADGTARAFLLARTRVLAHLSSIPSSAEGLAGWVEGDVSLGRAPMTDAETARAVQQLTIEGMAPVLAELDLARANVVLVGPGAEIDAAFAVLGRTPTRIATKVEDDDDPLGKAKPKRHKSEASLSLSDLAAPLTEQRPPLRLRLAVVPIAYTSGKVLAVAVSGVAFGAEVGLRLDNTTMVGVQMSLGKLTGMRDVSTGLIPDLRPIEIVPVGVNVFLQGSGYDRLWASVLIGVHANRVTDRMQPPIWTNALGLGIEGGVDLLKLGRHRLGLYGRAESELLSKVSYAGFVAGVAYRL